MRPRLRPLAIALVSACATRASQPTTPVLAPEPTQTVPEGTPERPAATYADLLRQVAARETQSSVVVSSCLLERVDNQLRFSGAATLSIRPVPLPGGDLEPQLERSVSVNVLTTQGRYGASPGALSLASFTYAQPTREAVALVVTDHGVYIRGVDARVSPRDRLPRDAAVEAAVQLQPATVFVAAEAEVSSAALSELLTALSSSRVPVALAVDLPPNVVLPGPTNNAEVVRCPDGLSASNEAEGDLPTDQLQEPIAQLRARGVDCLARADARGAAGGRVRLMLRIGSSGLVTEACISAEDIGDARLLSCIVTEARKLRFPSPHPKGSVDLELPLVLQPTVTAAAPELLCDAQLEQR